uniref:Uncharacterized protein n=1 Tax=Opuntia streptacantha TaxID=393608 RepID=A0A7C8YHV0_OPUST
MYPISATLYSTTIGISEHRLIVTWLDRDVALVNKVTYLRANVSTIGSFISTIVCSSGFSEEVFCLQVIFPDPMSPLVESVTPCFDTEMVTVSPMVARLEHMPENSDAGILTIASYSTSGIPR